MKPSEKIAERTEELIELAKKGEIDLTTSAFLIPAIIEHLDELQEENQKLKERVEEYDMFYKEDSEWFQLKVMKALDILWDRKKAMDKKDWNFLNDFLNT